MPQTNMQKVYQFLVIVMVVGLSMARPNGSVESQETPENQMDMSGVDKLSPYYRSLQPVQYFNYEEPNTLDRYQVQYRSFYPSSPFRGGGNANIPIWDPYRQLVSKRQTMLFQSNLLFP